MKVINFQYREYGDSIMLKMKDWRRITKFFTSHGITVTENFSPGALKAMGQLKKRRNVSTTSRAAAGAGVRTS